MAWAEGGRTTAHREQVVLEYEPHHRPPYTWHTFTPEWAQAVGVGEEALARLAAERRSKVTLRDHALGRNGQADGRPRRFEPGSTALEMIREGRPALLSGLKTLPETGEVSPELARDTTD